MTSPDLNEFDQRLNLTHEDWTLLGASFLQVVESAARFAPTPEAWEPLRALRHQAGWQAEFQYSLRDFLRLLYQGAELSLPRLGTREAFFEAVGELEALSFHQASTGKLAFSLFKGKTPVDILATTPAVYAARMNYGTRSFRRVDAQQGVLSIHDDPLPPSYHLGLLRTFVTFNGHPAVVEAKPTDLLNCDYLLNWNAPAGS
jgi:uncharacterized protein (TIGR02265 family)